MGQIKRSHISVAMERQVGEESGTGGLLGDDVVSNGGGFAF